MTTKIPEDLVPPASGAQTRGKVVLAARTVAKAYRQGSRTVEVLGNLDLSVIAGERIAIIGASGSGKSTLLNLLGGLDDPSEGSILVNGADIAGMNESRRAQWRNRHLGFVYQFHHLLGEFSALENVAMPVLIGGSKMADARRIGRQLLERVGLGNRLHHKPGALSGGERQRVAIARSLATSPTCVLMDEPTGNLDPDTAETVLTLILDLNRELATSFVIVTHDHDVAAKMDRVLRLSHGALASVSIAKAGDMATSPLAQGP